MSCPDCKTNNCGKAIHEITHGNMSLSYLLRKFKDGEITDDFIKRMEFDVARIDAALKQCISGT